MIPDQTCIKCAHCHLFIERNHDYDEYPALAEYVHLTRGDAADNEIEASHDAQPGQSQTLAWWKVHGPPEMRARFTE